MPPQNLKVRVAARRLLLNFPYTFLQISTDSLSNNYKRLTSSNLYQAADYSQVAAVVNTAAGMENLSAEVKNLSAGIVNSPAEVRNMSADNYFH
ncbi:hypothetical protein DMA11_07425 [Marinilabiliaceae bacterium JC017]|nr:hypothetical protein DMA11_07425 [Marinilabiliaceae bacterium JC017]